MVNEGLPGMSDAAAENTQGRSAGRKEYLVVARRYRPQAFEELVGQEHVARALSAAITSNRVGHAYLFTGARGVGKTSAARILAKCLNCERGPAPVPCNECESCRSIATGDDVDVLEIDGASNRGIEEMRELRHNVAIRPSRSRFKIYIIDEVHMLTREAFNALLKTLEEPPEHVKFIFCTTEAEKIPVTILSRCQRFDFAGIEAASIVGRLQQILAAEGVDAEPQALVLLSRRAGGSMRDSQSLLEQLLALGGKRVTVADVNHLLGTAADDRLVRLVGYLVTRDAAGALAEVDAAVGEGVDTGQLLDQLLVYFRDLMVAAVGGASDLLIQADPELQGTLAEQAGALGLHTVLAMMQVLDHTLNRLRYSTQGRVLAELAVVRICQLGDLEQIAAIIERLKTDGAGLPQPAPAPRLAPPASAAHSVAPSAHGASAKKNDEPAAAVSTPPRGETATQGVAPAGAAANEEPLADEAAAEPAAAAPFTGDPLALWQQGIAQLQSLVAEYAVQAERVTMPNPGMLVATFGAASNYCKAFCERPEQVHKIEQAVSSVAGRPLKVSFAVAAGVAEAEEAARTARRPMAARDRLREKASHPMVSRAMELFEARPVKVEEANG